MIKAGKCIKTLEKIRTENKNSMIFTWAYKNGK
jgi:hypothetical protein